MRACLWILAPVLCAQSFEVASIRPHPGEVTVSSDPILRGSRAVATASTPLDWITHAYGIRHDQVMGGPKWLVEDRFDLDANVPDGAPLTPEHLRIMMQDLLKDRFKLRVRWESRQVPIYAMIVAKNGAKLKPSPDDAKPGGVTRGAADGIHREVTKGTIEDLAKQLSVTAGRPVVDKTGLTGFYAYTLDWFPANRVPPPDSQVPSMFAALQEQLGLQLIAETGTEQYLVIENAERPSAN